MVTIRKAEKSDMTQLYDIALRAFQPDYERYGFYPPLLVVEKKRFLPPRVFCKAILADGEVIGGAFVTAFGKKGKVEAIFLNPACKGQGYGRQAMQAIEDMYPKVQTWTLDTPAESLHLHRFYESLGYVKAGELHDAKSGMTGFVYEKSL